YMDLGCWLHQGTLGLLRALDDLDHAPALPLGERPRFADAHRVAQLRAALVMRGDRLRAVDLLTVEAVGEATLHRDSHRLLHLVAHHRACPNFPPAALRHAEALSFKIVCMRAISRPIERS